MPKRLVLFSQPSPEIFEKLKTAPFPEYLTAKVFAYMPSEGDNIEANVKYNPIWQQFAESNGANFVFIDNSKRGDEAKIEAEKLLSANILMITGGNTFKLLNHLQLSGLGKTIQEFWRKDNIVLSGFSAGAIVLSPSIKTSKDTNYPGISDLSGLNIVDFEIWPHYCESQVQEVDEYKSKSQFEVKVIGNDEVVIIDK